MRDVYIADVDMTRGSIGEGSRMSVPVDTSFDEAYGAISNSDSVALQLSRDNEALKTELQSLKLELSETAEQVQHLTVQLADKERSLQAAKADMIETRLELQRNQEQLQVCAASLAGVDVTLSCNLHSLALPIWLTAATICMLGASIYWLGTTLW
jgi:septal ring factor EnvC (AmiA/AmiB activator)